MFYMSDQDKDSKTYNENKNMYVIKIGNSLHNTWKS